MKVLIDGDSIIYSAAASSPTDIYCYANAKRIIYKCLDRNYSDDYTLYLTEHDTNWRKQRVGSYKATRRIEKPLWYWEVWDYVIANYNTTVVSGIEADDAVAQNNFQEYTTICGIDKDLNTIPGWHYNWREDRRWFITAYEANRYFYKQMLMGDVADNIKGIPGIGNKKSEQILNDSKSMFRDYTKLAYQNHFKDDWKHEWSTNKYLLKLGNNKQ